MLTKKLLALMTSVTAAFCAASLHAHAQMSAVAKPVPPTKDKAQPATGKGEAKPSTSPVKSTTVKPTSPAKPLAKPVSKGAEKLEPQTPSVENGPEGGPPIAKPEMQSGLQSKQPLPAPSQTTMPQAVQTAPNQAPPGYGQYPPAYASQFPPPPNYQGQPPPPFSGQSYPGQPYAQPGQPAQLAPFQSAPRPQSYPNQPAYGYQQPYPVQRPFYQQTPSAQQSYPPPQTMPPSAQQGYPPQQTMPPFSQGQSPGQFPAPYPQQPPGPFAQTQPPQQFSQQPPPFSNLNPTQRPAPPAAAFNGQNVSDAPSDNMTEFLKNVGSARQLISAGNPAFAVEPLDKAVKLRPRNLSVYFYRGLAYDESGDPSRAVKDYMESLERAKTVGMDSAELRTNLGNSYMKLNFVPDAIIEYQKAIEIDPSSGAAHLQLGRAQLMKGDYNDALKNLRKAESLGYSDASLPYLKALSLAALGSKEEARNELAPLLSEDARDRSPQLNNLAQDLAKELK
ncbi:tetratricopeptide repeat protein [Candidatus Obscuribacterales bacterium]|nr:tetratricopeptide repeat protein [Candidatus Obscuribacterales bacterium]MBX3152613.1 tetratricopeptide repeat protein [Candidatus Obscuribacterales bacterium]